MPASTYFVHAQTATIKYLSPLGPLGTRLVIRSMNKVEKANKSFLVGCRYRGGANLALSNCTGKACADCARLSYCRVVQK